MIPGLQRWIGGSEEQSGLPPVTDEQIINLSADDEIGAIRDKIIWAESGRIVLVVPYRNRALRDKMNLKLVQRTAVDQAVKVALVAFHPETAKLASEIGLPVFWTKSPLPGTHNWGAAAEPQFKQGDHEEDLRVVAPTEPRMSRTYRIAGAAALGTFVALVLLVTALLIPSARIALAPTTEQTSVKVEIQASAALKASNKTLAQIPGRIEEIVLEGSEEIVPANRKDMPDARASGPVVLTSKSDQPVKLPKGTIVATSGGVPVRFATNTDVELAPRGRAEIIVTAVEPGPAGNVARFTINTVDGPFALAVNAVNSGNMSGGTMKRVPVVEEADKARVSDALVRRLRQEAVTRFQAILKENEFVSPETVSVTLETRTYDKLAGEATETMKLSAIAKAQGLIVNGTDANLIALEVLRTKVRTGFELLPGSVEFQPGGVTKATTESVWFELTAKGKAATAIDRSHVVNSIRGMTTAEAAEWLNRTFLLRRNPTVELRSDVLGTGRLPFFPFRMQVEVAE